MFVHVVDNFGLLAGSRPENAADNLPEPAGELDWGGKKKCGKTGGIKAFAHQLQGRNKDLNLAAVKGLDGC